LSGTGNVWNVTTPTNLTVSAGSSSITITNGNSTIKTFTGGGKTYAALELPTGVSNPSVTIADANTFGTIDTGTNGKGTLNLTAGTTTTVTNFTPSGTSGNLYTLDSTTGGTPATLSKASGTVSISFMSIKDSTASGGATFNATSSTDATGNTGWNFLAAATNEMFFAFFLGL
jgi:hypothetical protein